jgi:hypothetical protein
MASSRFRNGRCRMFLRSSEPQRKLPGGAGAEIDELGERAGKFSAIKVGASLELRCELVRRVARPTLAAVEGNHAHRVVVLAGVRGPVRWSLDRTAWNQSLWHRQSSSSSSEQGRTSLSSSGGGGFDRMINGPHPRRFRFRGSTSKRFGTSRGNAP